MAWPVQGVVRKPMDAECRKLEQLYRNLDQQGRAMLLEYAQFLATRYPRPDEGAIEQQPQPIERPEEETVVAALKRLSSTYPMLDKGKILNHASALMAEHVMGGREASDVIDELESLFDQHYRESIQKDSGDN